MTTVEADHLRRALRDSTGYMSDAERKQLLLWAQKLSAVAKSDRNVLHKSVEAVRLTLEMNVVWPFMRQLLERLKKVGWDDRGLKSRLALSGGAIGMLMFGGHGAGIAALGGAIGVPLWLVFAGGGALLGVVIEELSDESAPTTKHRVIDADRE